MKSYTFKEYKQMTENKYTTIEKCLNILKKNKKEYKKMEKVVESLIPIENIINEFNTIKNLQNLISANGNNFNLTQDELELAQKLF